MAGLDPTREKKNAGRIAGFDGFSAPMVRKLY